MRRFYKTAEPEGGAAGASAAAVVPAVLEQEQLAAELAQSLRTQLEGKAIFFSVLRIRIY